MDIDAENLGPATSWHIRSVPEAVRQAVVDRAHQERTSVGDLLTRMVIGATGATPVAQHAIDGRGDALPASHAVVPALPAPHPVDAVAHAVDADRLLSLLQAADLLGKVPLGRGAAGATRAMIGNELRMMRKAQRTTSGLPF